MADDYRKFIEDSRTAGYKDEDIQQSLRKGGWKEPDIQQAFSSVPQADTFLGESGLQGAGNLLTNLQNSGHTINPSDLWQTLQGMYQGQKQETGQELGDAQQQLSRGNLSGALSHFIAGTPLVGHPLVHGVHNLVTGNYGAVAGDALSLFGPQLVKLLGEGAVSGARTAGAQLYRHNLPFEGASSIRDIEGAVRTGIADELPAQALFSKSGRTLDHIGRSDQPDTVMGNLEDLTKYHVTGAAGARPVNLETALAPFLKEIQGRLEAPTASGKQIAGAMMNEARPLLEKMSPLMRHVFDPDALGPGLGYTTEQKAQLVEFFARNNRSALTVGQAHIGKRGMYNTLSDSMFVDNSGQVPPGSKAANLSLSRGYKDAINEAAPEMAPINSHMHNLITLTDAMNTAAKASPKEFRILMNLAIGGALGSVPTMMGGAGVHTTAGAGVAGALALQALQSPAIATRLAIVMGKKFPDLAEKLHATTMSQVAAAAPNALRNVPLQELFKQLPQQ